MVRHLAHPTPYSSKENEASCLFGPLGIRTFLCIAPKDGGRLEEPHPLPGSRELSGSPIRQQVNECTVPKKMASDRSNPGSGEPDLIRTGTSVASQGTQGIELSLSYPGDTAGVRKPLL